MRSHPSPWIAGADAWFSSMDPGQWVERSATECRRMPSDDWRRQHRGTGRRLAGQHLVPAVGLRGERDDDTVSLLPEFRVIEVQFGGNRRGLQVGGTQFRQNCRQLAGMVAE